MRREVTDGLGVMNKICLFRRFSARSSWHADEPGPRVLFKHTWCTHRTGSVMVVVAIPYQPLLLLLLHNHYIEYKSTPTGYKSIYWLTTYVRSFVPSYPGTSLCRTLLCYSTAFLLKSAYTYVYVCKHPSPCMSLCAAPYT